MIPKRPGETAGALGRRTREPRSALRVLRRLASPLQAVLLALLGPRVPGQQAGLAEGGARVGMGREECAGDAMADGAHLAGDAATGDEDAGRVAALGLGHLEREVDRSIGHRAAEVLGGGLAVDDDTAVTRQQADARDGGLAPAGPVDVVRAHDRPSYSSTAVGCCAWC